VTANEIRALGEASQWLIRLRDQSDSESCIDEWLQWRERDPANTEAFRRVQQLWRQLDDAYVVPSDVDALLASETGQRRARGSGLAGLGRRLADSRSRWAAAAMLACVIGGGFLWAWNRSQNEETLAASSGTASRTLTLPDGSSMDLGPKTSVTVDFQAQQRSLQLSPGEAFFTVRPDRKRPFVVHAGALNATAVGTAFDVKHEPGRVTVTVQEGVVAVELATGGLGAAPDSTWQVTAGYQLVHSAGDATTILASVDTSSVLAWRSGRLEYVNAPLSAVVADLSRYTPHPIELKDARAAGLTFTGTVFTDSIDSWLQALPEALPVRVMRAANGVSLSSASNPGPKTAERNTLPPAATRSSN
jgi:transmembrane sensor